jgi:lysophospholipase L1-like esterase
MFRNISVGIISIFLFFLISGCDSTPRIDALGSSSLVLAFGDSLTYGTGADRNQDYPSVLSRMMGVPVINAGVPGEVTAEGMQRLPGLLKAHKPSLVILCHGGNDFLKRRPLPETIANLRNMLTLIQAHDADAVLVGVPRLGLGLDVPDFYASLAEEFHIPFESELLVSVLSENDMKSDLIHPNTEGYRLMAESLYDLIERAQGKR